MQDFGLLLKTLRTNAGYTQQELAELLHTTDSSISKWERSVSVPDAVSIRKISQILNSIIIGIAVGSQPIIGFNYGAKKYDRAKKTFLIATITATIICIVGGIFIQFFMVK